MAQTFCQLLDVVYVAAACSRSTIRRIRYSSANNDDDDGLDINGVCGNDDCGNGEGNSDGDIDNGGSNGGCGLGGNGENRVGASKDDDGRGGGNIGGNSEDDDDDDDDWIRGKKSGGRTMDVSEDSGNTRTTAEEVYTVVTTVVKMDKMGESPLR